MPFFEGKDLLVLQRAPRIEGCRDICYLKLARKRWDTTLMIPIILASSSQYRRQLLERLNLSFTASEPTVDEEQIKTLGLSPKITAERLAYEKAFSVYAKHKRDVCVIGGDQLVSLKDKIIGKAGSKEQAVHDLLQLGGQTHELITAIAVIHPQETVVFTDVTSLTMRRLTEEQARRYIELDQSFDCAGSYKIEKHGIGLFEKIKSEDHSAIQGIPLIALTRILTKLGYQVP